MDYSNAKISLVRKDLQKNGARFKIDFLKGKIKEVRLFDNNGRHEKFINDVDKLVANDCLLSER